MPWVSCAALLLSVSALSPFPFAQAQYTQDSWPHVYPGMPTSDYGPEWQNYFQVTESLPNVTWPLSRNWAGNIPVQRVGHPNDTLFFWAFESSNGSLTTNSSEPWGIWLNGGPGTSSFLGLFFENGPISILNNYSAAENQYAWTNVADYVWIDQPVYVGVLILFSPKLMHRQMGFLENLVKVFPGLATRPLYITGESYAGTWIPYITKAYFEMDNPPVNLAGIAIGNGVLTNMQTFMELPVISVLETYPQIIGYDTEVFEYFREQYVQGGPVCSRNVYFRSRSALCGYNLTLQYPQPEHFPTLKAPLPFLSSAYSGTYDARFALKGFVHEVQDRFVTTLKKRDGPLAHGQRLHARDWKRGLAGRANGTIDPWYQCDVYSEMIDYAVNSTFPWCMFPFFSITLVVHPTIRLLALNGINFDHYNIPDALSPEVPTDASVFLNDPRTRAAIHAPTSKDWIAATQFVWALADSPSKQLFLGANTGLMYLFIANLFGDPSNFSSLFKEYTTVYSRLAISLQDRPMAFLTDLATNATAHDVAIVIYSGNDDAVVTHFGSQIAIQNTTFGGIQGFTRKPETPWYNHAGEYAGVVHQERGWTYLLAAHAGHLFGYTNPSSALTLVREFIFGNNQTGLVTNTSSGTVSVIGGEVSSLGGEIMTGQAAIYYGKATTASSYFFPSATVEAWNAYIARPRATSRVDE
ncbi:Alpha/Beta hydrolase protein [Lanmaoa asiatica]|nr:Alpha/Beta hydrolase protein [Lanmaoa asiatica]